MQKKADIQLEAKLDKNDYQETDLIEISVPLNLPYQTDQADFERVDGEIEMDGTLYKYVKRKIERGHLVLKCIPHHKKEQVLNARDVFFKLVNELQQDQPDKKSASKNGIAKLNISDYEKQHSLKIDFTATAVITKYERIADVYFNSNDFRCTPEQPPEAIML